MTQTVNSGERSLLVASAGFASWLEAANASVALTTYQAGRIIFVGRRADGSLRANERMVDQCQGLWTDAQELLVSSRSMLWRFVNELPPGARAEAGADRRFVPREARVTGAVDIHDIAVGDTGGGATGAIFVCTGFNCLGTVSDKASFRPLWKPPFISGLVAEDRCHLNGLAMEGRRPAFVTAVARTDSADAWRERRRDGGVVVDIASGEIVADGLSMPHSPRLHAGRLWLLNSGSGEFGHVDTGSGSFTPVAFCPGYARGLAFVNGHAVIGLSRPRNNRTFEDLALGERLASKGVDPQCGLLVVELASGRIVEWLRFERTIEELYDVAVLPGVAQPEAVGLRANDIQRLVTPE